jgi:putative cell wall-binding protein
MRSLFRSASLAIAAMLMLAVAPSAAFAAVRSQSSTPTVSFSDTFDTLDASVWRPLFYGMSWGPSSGVATVTAGVATMRPAASRGISVLESANKIVASLPAHVHFRVRFSGTEYRSCNIMLINGPSGVGNTYDFPYLQWHLGKTNHWSSENPLLRITDATGAMTSTSASAPGVVPTGTWLDGDLWLERDRMTSEFNGVKLTVLGDVKSIVDLGSGLNLQLFTSDDYGQRGLDVDQFYVDNASVPSSVLSGRVTDGGTGAGLAGIRVSAWQEPIVSGASFTAAGSALTSADGSYEITVTTDGWHEVTFDDPANSYRDQSLGGSGLPLGWSPAVKVTLGTDIHGIDERLTPKTWLLTNRAIRVSGADRYQTALTISRANYASANTIVLASGTGFADACAAAPLCGAYHGPLLLTSRDVLPRGFNAELTRLHTRRIMVVGSSSAVSDAIVKSLRASGLQVTRLYGRDRYETAGAIVGQLIAMGAKMPAQPFVVRGDTFPDALSAGPFADAQVRPVLLVKPQSAPSPTIASLVRLHASTVYVVGGTAAVGTGALRDLASGTTSHTISYYRIAGNDRYSTSEEMLKAWGWPYDRLGVATGDDFPAALTGGVALGERWGGLLLSRPDVLDAGATALIAQNGRYLWPVQVFGTAPTDGLKSSIAFATGTSFMELEDPLTAAAPSAKAAAAASAAPRSATPRLPLALEQLSAGAGN